MIVGEQKVAGAALLMKAVYTLFLWSLMAMVAGCDRSLENNAQDKSAPARSGTSGIPRPSPQDGSQKSSPVTFEFRTYRGVVGVIELTENASLGFRSLLKSRSTVAREGMVDKSIRNGAFHCDGREYEWHFGGVLCDLSDRKKPRVWCSAALSDLESEMNKVLLLDDATLASEDLERLAFDTLADDAPNDRTAR